MTATMTVRDHLDANLDNYVETFRVLMDAVDRGGWHDEEEHTGEDPGTCPECRELTEEHGDTRPEGALDALPLELVAEVGKPLVVLLTYGGPLITLEWDLRDRAPVLGGWWGSGTTAARHDPDLFRRVMGYYFPEVDL